MKTRLHVSPFSQAGKFSVVALAAAAVAATIGASVWVHHGQGNSGFEAAVPSPTASAASAPVGAASSTAVSSGAAGSRRFAAGRGTQPVTVGVVEQRNIRVMVNAIGNITALNTAIVRAKIDGEVKAIRFKEGDLVRAGQVLAELDGRSQAAQLAQAQGQLVRDQAQLRNAQLDWQRYQDLLAKDSIAKQQVDTQEALVKQLQGTVQSDQGQVDNARLQLSYTQVTAPISGRAGLKQVDLGTVARASDANGVVTITQTQPIALVFAVPESRLPQIKAKMGGKAPLTVQVWDREQRSKLGEGRVVSLDNAIDPTTGTIKVKAEFANTDGSLFPNQFVNVRLQVDTLSGATAIPDAAIQRGPQGTFVYAIKADGTVTMRRVRLGVQEGDWWSVQGELAVGEKVVTDGADRLREGAKVEVIAPTPSRAASTAEGRTRKNTAAGG
jgi:membrane fusion protein, multidrug efflux system